MMRDDLITREARCFPLASLHRGHNSHAMQFHAEARDCVFGKAYLAYDWRLVAYS